MNDAPVAPVRKSLRVACSPARAFETFAGGIGRWWLKSHSINRGGAPQRDVVIEPRVGGRWYEIGEDGSQCDWGEVLVWAPPARLVLAWRIDAQWRFDAALTTELEVRFTPDGDGGARVELEHRLLANYGEAATRMAAAFDSPEGWSGLLARYAGAATA